MNYLLSYDDGKWRLRAGGEVIDLPSGIDLVQDSEDWKSKRIAELEKCIRNFVDYTDLNTHSDEILNSALVNMFIPYFKELLKHSTET